MTQDIVSSMNDYSLLCFLCAATLLALLLATTAWNDRSITQYKRRIFTLIPLSFLLAVYSVTLLFLQRG